MIYPYGFDNNVLRRRPYRILAALLSLILIIVTTYIVPSLASARSETPVAPSVLIFPFTNGSTVSKDSDGLPITTSISGNVRLDINALGFYHATGYSVLNPSIKRALEVEQSISEADLEAPTATADRSQKLASIVDTPYFLVGNIDSITTDPTSGTVTVSLDGTFYNTETGAVIKQANVTGTAAPASKDYDPDQLQTSAIASASGQLVAALLGFGLQHHATETSVVPKSHVSSNYGKGILFLLAVALALVIVHNHGGTHSNSSSSSNSTSGGTSTTSTNGPPAPP